MFAQFAIIFILSLPIVGMARTDAILNCSNDTVSIMLHLTAPFFRMQDEITLYVYFSAPEYMTLQYSRLIRSATIHQKLRHGLYLFKDPKVGDGDEAALLIVREKNTLLAYDGKVAVLKCAH